MWMADVHYVDTLAVGAHAVGILVTGHSRAAAVGNSPVDIALHSGWQEVGMTAVQRPGCFAAAVVASIEGYGYVGRKTGEGRSGRHSSSRAMRSVGQDVAKEEIARVGKSRRRVVVERDMRIVATFLVGNLEGQTTQNVVSPNTPYDKTSADDGDENSQF